MTGFGRLAGARPNAAHNALTALEQRGYIKHIITQNVDRLHQSSGSERVLELHGTIHEIECLECGGKESRSDLQPRLEAHNPEWTSTLNAAGLQHRPDGKSLCHVSLSCLCPSSLSCTNIWPGMQPVLFASWAGQPGGATIENHASHDLFFQRKSPVVSHLPGVDLELNMLMRVAGDVDLPPGLKYEDFNVPPCIREPCPIILSLPPQLWSTKCNFCWPLAS